jgi:hypothetical protein
LACKGWPLSRDKAFIVFTVSAGQAGHFTETSIKSIIFTEWEVELSINLGQCIVTEYQYPGQTASYREWIIE